MPLQPLAYISQFAPVNPTEGLAPIRMHPMIKKYIKDYPEKFTSIALKALAACNSLDIQKRDLDLVTNVVDNQAAEGEFEAAMAYVLPKLAALAEKENLTILDLKSLLAE